MLLHPFPFSIPLGMSSWPNRHVCCASRLVKQGQHACVDLHVSLSYISFTFTPNIPDLHFSSCSWHHILGNPVKGVQTGLSPHGPSAKQLYLICSLNCILDTFPASDCCFFFFFFSQSFTPSSTLNITFCRVDEENIELPID